MRSPILIALVHPLSLAVLGLSLFAGLVAAWWLFPLGLLIWLVMVVLVSRDASLRLNYEVQSRAPLARRFQRYFDRVERSQLSIFNSLASAPVQTRRVLQPVQDQVDALTAQVYALCQRMTTLENYRVVSESQSNLETDLQHVNAVLDSTTDPVVRREYQESRRSIEERLAKITAAGTLLDRVEAQLLSLASDLDGVVSEVMRLQGMSPRDASTHVSRITRDLREQSDQLGAFQREAINL
jgi:hypothetical protein